MRALRTKQSADLHLVFVHRVLLLFLSKPLMKSIILSKIIIL